MSTAPITVAADAAAPGATLLPAGALRRAVLESLAGGWRRTSDIPAPWPLLHAHVASAVALLYQHGLLERRADSRAGGAAPVYRLNDAGRRALLTTDP